MKPSLLGQKPQGIQIDLSKMPQYMCDCGGVVFTKIHEVRLLPAIVSPSGQPMPVLVEVGVRCVSCNNEVSMMDLQKEAANTTANDVGASSKVEIVKD